MECLRERGRSPRVLPLQTVRRQPSALTGALHSPSWEGLTIPPMPEEPVNGPAFAPQLFTPVAPKVGAEEGHDRIRIPYQCIAPLQLSLAVDALHPSAQVRPALLLSMFEPRRAPSFTAEPSDDGRGVGHALRTSRPTMHQPLRSDADTREGGAPACQSHEPRQAFPQGSLLVPPGQA